jgi:hypothetical protein
VEWLKIGPEFKPPILQKKKKNQDLRKWPH